MITDGEDGMLVELQNEAALADKILLVLNNVNLRKKLEQNAFKKAQFAFSNKHMFKLYKKVFA